MAKKRDFRSKLETSGKMPRPWPKIFRKYPPPWKFWSFLLPGYYPGMVKLSDSKEV